MIVGDNFIWLHFPKCAGLFTENILRKYFENTNNISFDPIDPSNIIWHQNVSTREQMLALDLSEKDIICNFRRLPSWIISRIKFEELRSGFSVPRNLMVKGQFFEADNTISHADEYLKRYNEKLVKHWIRQEYISTDFYNAFLLYIDINKVPLIEFDQIINSSGVNSVVDEWFSNAELIELYESCPLWAQHEKFLYGNVLID
jgi:hypothetical protein